MGQRRNPETEEDRQDRRERAILVGIDRGNQLWPLDESLAELERLAHTAGVDVVATATQKLDRPHTKTFIGSGKAEEVAGLVKELDASLVIFDDDLTPRSKQILRTLSPTPRSLIVPLSYSTYSPFTQPAERASSKSSWRRWSTCCRGSGDCGGIWTSTRAAAS